MEPATTFRKDLQGLRAIAVILVILAHARIDAFAGGFVGVDVFFVLSGFLITQILYTELKRDNHIRFARFYARRIKRLLPALLFVLLASSIAAISLLSPSESYEQLASLPYAATWTSNFHFLFQTTDYFDELASRDLFLHTWSLGVEEQFYLLWPLFLFALYRSLGPVAYGGASPSTDQRQRRIVIALVAALLCSLALSLYWSGSSTLRAFYLMPARIWQFSLGALTFFLLFNWNSHSSLQQKIDQRAKFYSALFLGLAMIVGSALVLDANLAYPGFYALFPSLGAALVIASAHFGSTPKLLENRALVWLGDRSYSLYLWHWPVLTIGFSLGLENNTLALLGLLLICLIAAHLSYCAIERPFWKGRWSHGQPVFTLLVSVLLISQTVFVAYHGVHKNRLANVKVDVSYIWRADDSDIYRMSCDTWYESAEVTPCRISGESGAERTAVLLGDSIGVQWASAIPEVFPAPQWQVIVYTKSACPMVDEEIFYSGIGAIFEICEQWRNEVIAQLASLSPDVVMLGSASTYDYTDEQWIEGSARILQSLSQLSDQVLLLPGTPGLGFDGPGCLSRLVNSDEPLTPGKCRSEGQASLVSPVTALLQAAANRFSNVHLLDLNALVCPADSCDAINDDGVAIYRDSMHLTDSIVRAWAPQIVQRVAAVVTL